jgi:hypothetical protein
MRKRDLKKDIALIDMLLDDNEQIRKDVIIECLNCQSRDFKIDAIGGTTLMCKECENTISISFVKNDEQKINGIEFKVGDIVENEAFRDVVVLRNGVLTTERNLRNQPLKIHEGLKVIGNIKDNPKMVEELKTINTFIEGITRHMV